MYIYFMKTGIYKISNTINNRVYIGSAINLRLRKNRHITSLNNKKHHNIKLQRFVNKYGIDKLRFEIIQECDKTELIELEQFYIDKYNCVKKGFNILPTAGSWLGHNHSEVSKIKQSESKKGIQSKGMLNKKHSIKTKELIASKATGRKQSKETVRKRALKNTGKKRPESAIETVRIKLNKLKDYQVYEIRKMLEKGVRQIDIAAKFRVSQRNISRIKNGISYKDF